MRVERWSGMSSGISIRRAWSALRGCRFGFEGWRMRFRVLPLLFCCCFAGRAQWPGVEFKPEPGTNSLESRYDHATWASPESIVRDLRSDEEGTRVNALQLFGYPEAELLDAPKP